MHAQRSAEGKLCKTTAFWDGKIHKSRMEPVEGSRQGRRTESWRFMDSGMMVGDLNALQILSNVAYTGHASVEGCCVATAPATWNGKGSKPPVLGISIKCGHTIRISVTSVAPS